MSERSFGEPVRKVIDAARNWVHDRTKTDIPVAKRHALGAITREEVEKQRLLDTFEQGGLVGLSNAMDDTHSAILQEQANKSVISIRESMQERAKKVK